MSFQLRRRLGLADGVTLLNAVLGFVAAAVTFWDPTLAARLLLLAVVADALDGIVARSAGNTAVGPLLDSVADVVSFGAAPGLLVVGAFTADAGGLGALDVATLAVVLLVGASFSVFSVVRTAFYTVHVDPAERRPGVQNSLGATIVGALYLAAPEQLAVLAAVSLVLAVLMVAPFGYPKLHVRDAVVLGLVQALAILVPGYFDGIFPATLLVAATAYLVLGPRYYWGPERSSPSSSA